MKEKIIRAAAKIISHEGLEAASTRAICDAVKITAPTLYYHFKSKRELIDSVTSFTFELHRDLKLKIRTQDPMANLRMYWDQYMNFYLKEPELHRAMIVALAQGSTVKVGYSCFKDLLNEFKALEKLGHLNYSALECAQIYLASAQGLSLILMAQPKPESLPSSSNVSREISLAGLIKSANQSKKMKIVNN